MIAEVKRILLVEDSANDIELTLTALAQSNLGNEVAVVRDGEEALEFVFRRGRYADRGNGDPVVILLDLKLPKVDGLEVLRQLKSEPATARIPVVMLTSSREERDLAASYRLGVNAYVVKPVDFGEFMAALRELGLFWAVINHPPPPPGGPAAAAPKAP